MEIKKCLLMFVVLFIFTSSLTTINLPIKAVEPPESSSPPYVRVYVDQPLGYIPAVPVGDTVAVDIIIEVANITDDSTEGIIGWGLNFTVDPNVLNITRVKGAASSYFLWEFADYYWYPYPTLISYKNATGGRGSAAEQFLGGLSSGAGDPWSGLKLVTLEFISKSETVYSKIDVVVADYRTADGKWHAFDEIVDGDYNQPVYRNLTVNSTPIDGINFTIDSTTYTTSTSVNLLQKNYTVTMPDPWMNGIDQYNFVKWEDNSANPVRIVSLTSNITIIATYERQLVDPVAFFTFSPTNPNVSETVTFDASASYDPDGTVIGYSWAFGDETIANDTGPITTHAYADAGNYTVTLYVYDDDYQPDSYTLNVTVTRMHAVDSPYIKVDPKSIVNSTLNPGENFTVSIYTDYTGVDVTSYQFNLSYNPDVLQGVQVVNGDLIVGGSAQFKSGKFNNTSGELSLTVGFYFAEGEVTSGPGTLANVTFTIVDEGTSNINIGNRTKLIGWDFFEWKEYDIIDAATMPNQIQHGYFDNLFSHDVAIIGVTPFPTSVRSGEPINITVIVENQGTNSETNFNVTVYYSGTVIETKTVQDLAAGASENLTFTWNTTDAREEVYNTTYKQKTYFIDATASTVPGETDTEDNTLRSNSTVEVISYYIAVAPESIVDTTLTPGKNFTVSIYTDYNGTDIWAWQFSLTYNPLVLQGVSVTNGDLITKTKHDSAELILGTFNNTLGRLSLTCAYFFYVAPDEPYVTSGPGILANITFTVVGIGDSDINLIEERTELMGYGDGEAYGIISDWEPYFYHIISGYFKNTAEIVTHDVAVVSVTFSPTSVKPGEPVNITVVVENQGTVAETFIVAAYYGTGHPSYLIATPKTVQTLEAGTNISLAFVWDTTDISAITTAIWAEAGTVPGETDTNDNTLRSDEMIEVLPLPARAHILFDQTHGAFPIYDYSYWVMILQIAGYVVDTHIYGPITSTVLETYDIFVIPEAYIYYSSAELSAIHDFVFNGGGLLVIGDDNPEIYTELTSFTGISWSYGGSSGITTDITFHEVTQNVASIDMQSPNTEMYVTGAAQGLIRDPYGGIMLAVSEQFGRVVGFADEGTFSDYYIFSEDNLQLAKNMIDWLTPIQYEHELLVGLDTPYYLEPDYTSRLNATVYNRGLNNETNVELELFINDILVNSTVVAFLPANASYTISYMWTPTDEGTHNVTAYALPVPSENVTVNNVATRLVAVTYPLIRPIEGQWANYTLNYMEDDTIISAGKWSFSYDHYVSPYLINITIWQDITGYTQTSWMVVNIMNRKVESSGPMAGSEQWFFGWIETDIELGSTVNLMTDTATVIGSKIVEVDGYFLDCWELEYSDLYYGIRYIFWYDKISGLLIGMEYGYPYYYSVPYYYKVNLILTATNIPIGVLPIASFTHSPSDPFIGETVTFDASASYDPNRTIVSYTWDFGDNTTGTGLTANHVYTKAETYTVTLTVTNDEGLANTATATVTVSRTTLDVEVDVGSIHFRGEMAEFYVLVSSMGEPVDAAISTVLYYSNGTLHEELTDFTEHVATGLYRLPYTIPIDAPTGTYVLVANASLFTIKGSSLKSFLLSPTLTDAWLVDIEDDIVTIKTDISTIKVSLENINAKIEDIIEMLPYKNKVAVINTDIGTVRAYLIDINAELTAFNGKTATIKTDVGTLNTDTENIELKVTNVDGKAATISTILGTIQGTVLSIQDDIVIIETDIGTVEAALPPTQTTTPIKTPIEWALLFLAATASIIVIAATLLRKYKGTNHKKPKPPTFFEP